MHRTVKTTLFITTVNYSIVKAILFETLIASIDLTLLTGIILFKKHSCVLYIALIPIHLSASKTVRALKGVVYIFLVKLLSVILFLSAQLISYG